MIVDDHPIIECIERGESLDKFNFQFDAKTISFLVENQELLKMDKQKNIEEKILTIFNKYIKKGSENSLAIPHSTRDFISRKIEKKLFTKNIFALVRHGLLIQKKI